MISPELKAEIKSRWAGMDANQRKLVVFVIGLLLALLLATHPMTWLTRVSVRRRPTPAAPRIAPARAPLPAMARGAAVSSESPAPGASPLQSPGVYAGKYQGHGSVKRGFVTLVLELRQETADKFLAYPAMTCAPFPSYFTTGKADSNPAAYLDTLQKANPMTAILSGQWKDGALPLKVERITGNDSGCGLTSMIVTPFGSSGITAEWTDNCGGGSLLMAKLPAQKGTL